MQEPQFAALVGIDWTDRRHVWCLQSDGSEPRERGELEHSPEVVEAWVGQLCQRFANRPIAVAVEQSRGALVFMLSKYEPLHLFPVPSTMSANLRGALYPRSTLLKNRSLRFRLSGTLSTIWLRVLSVASARSKSAGNRCCIVVTVDGRNGT